MNTYLQDIAAKNADLVSIGIRFTGSSFVDAKAIRRADLALYAIGTAWKSTDRSTSFVVVSHPSAA